MVWAGSTYQLMVYCRQSPGNSDKWMVYCRQSPGNSDKWMASGYLIQVDWEKQPYSEQHQSLRIADFFSISSRTRPNLMESLVEYN